MDRKTNQALKNLNLLNILHIADPTLPIGGFSHSNGLETYVQQRIVDDVPTTFSYIESMLKNNYKYNDALFLRYAHELSLKKDRNGLFALDEKCHSLKSPFEVRDGSYKLGTRLLKIYTELIDNVFLDDYFKAVSAKQTNGHYAIVFGIITAIMQTDVKQALSAFYYNAAISMVVNAVKLVPLGQIDGQKIIFKLLPLIDALTNETLLVERNMLGMCNPAFDIRCMQHERLYSRLYMS